MPHDADHELLGFGNKNRRQMFEAAGIRPITVVPRVRSIHEGIEQARAKFSAYWFDKTRCERGLECLANYAYVRNEGRAEWAPEPLHNWASHAADALRQHAQGYRNATAWSPAGPQVSERRERALERHRHTATASASWVV